jgi:pimeloyl-ACP methyl ester carboxylesterase
VVHDYALFTRQVAELLGHLGICRDIDLLGHSLGAVVAARLLSLEPSRYGALVITAPMLNFSGVNGAMNLLSAPIVGELLMYLYVLPMLVCRRTIRYRKIEDGRFVTMFRQQFRVPGFGRSLLSLVRSGALGDQGPCYIALRELPNPVMLLSGSHDVIANPAQMKTLQEILPRAEPRVVDGASHALLLTHPAQAAAHISRFLA